MPSPIWRGTNFLIEQSNSPRWVFGESVTLEVVFKGPYSLCLSSAPGFGAIGIGTAAGLRVKESTVTRERGGIGVLTIAYAPYGTALAEFLPLPPDTESLERNQLEYALQYHSMFESVTSQQLTDINTVINTSWEDPVHGDALDRVNANFAAGQLLLKKQKGILFWVEFPPIYSRTSYSWDKPTGLNGGGKTEVPVTASLTLPEGFLWLRHADSVSHNGTHFELSRKWQGSKEIDPDLYPPA